MLRFRIAALAALAAVAALLSPAPPASAAPLTQVCYSVRSAGETQSHGLCFQVMSRLTRDYKVGYRDSLINKTSRTAQFDFQATESKTFSFGASVTIKEEFSAGIFAKIEASVTAEMSKSLASGTAVNAGISVPAHTTTYCDRVVYRDRFKVRRCTVYYRTYYCGTPFVFFGPTRRGWVLSDAIG